MDHEDHVGLIRDGVAGLERGSWAELGSGTGAFTLALADLLVAPGSIVSVDRDADVLREQARRVGSCFPSARLRIVEADFRLPLELPALDGLLMANSLHFVLREEQPEVLGRLLGHLRAGGRFILVEYDADHGNPWVPYPISWGRWQGLAHASGLREVRLLGRVPSRFLGAIYSAVGTAPATTPAMPAPSSLPGGGATLARGS